MRFLINELTELPEGTFKDEDASIFDLNDIINISQQNVYLRLLHLVPEEFRKSFKISLTAAKNEYNIVSDCSIADFWRMEDIYHNELAKPKHGLLYVDLDQIADIGIDVGETGVDPKCWYWESKGVIGILPVPSSTVAERLKAYYFYEIPDLNHDTDDVSPNVATPLLPKVAHKLIAIDGVRQLQIASEEGALEVIEIYKREEENVLKLLGMKPSFASDRRQDIRQRSR